MAKRKLGNADLSFPKYSATVNYHLNAIYRILFEAADESQPCPSNHGLMNLVRGISETTISKYIRILEDARHITVQRYAARRVVRIEATGRKTQPTVWSFTKRSERKGETPWSPNDLARLEIEMESKTPRELAEDFARSVDSIRAQQAVIRNRRKAAGLPVTYPGKPGPKPKAKPGRPRRMQSLWASGPTAAPLDAKAARAHKPRTWPRATECRWPLWSDTDTDKTKFCCAAVRPESPYCETHHRRAHSSPATPVDIDAKDPHPARVTPNF